MFRRAKSSIMWNLDTCLLTLMLVQSCVMFYSYLEQKRRIFKNPHSKWLFIVTEKHNFTMNWCCTEKEHHMVWISALGWVNDVITIIFGCFIPSKQHPLWKSHFKRHSQVILVIITVFNLDWEHVASVDLSFSDYESWLWIMASAAVFIWVWVIKPRAIRNDVLVVYLCTVRSV